MSDAKQKVTTELHLAVHDRNLPRVIPRAQAWIPRSLPKKVQADGRDLGVGCWAGADELCCETAGLEVL